MQERSQTAACAVSLLFLLVASGLVWAEFGALAVKMMRALAGG